MAEIDSDMNLIMNMLLTKLTVKQTLLEDRDKQLGSLGGEYEHICFNKYVS